MSFDVCFVCCVFFMHVIERIIRRNRRLAEFDAKRAQRRAEADAEDDNDADAGDADAQRAAMIAGMSGANLNDSDDDSDGGEYVKKERKAKGLEGIIETENANRATVKNIKIGDLGTEQQPMTRREREEKEKAAKAAAYRKRHEAGLTEEYKRDMAKLAEVKARREAAAAKKAAEEEAAKLAEDERKKKAESAGAFDDSSDSDSDSDDDKKKKKKKSSKSKKKGGGGCDAPKLDKITIKKMKPAQLKEALKERGLDIQGNAKTLTARLLEFEAAR